MNKALTLAPTFAPARAEPVAMRARNKAANESFAPLATPTTLAPSWPAKPAVRRGGMLLVVAALHLLVGWLLATHLKWQPAVVKHESVEVRLLAPPPPPTPPVQPPRAAPVNLPLVAPAPLITPPPLNIANPIANTIVMALADNTPPRPAPVVAAPVVTPGSRVIPANAVHYIVEPQLNVPRMSRRLGESGTVLLHIAVDAHGRLKAAAIKKSSGFERLDEQALQDIRSARFSPYLENGQPIDWETDAALQYEVR